MGGHPLAATLFANNTAIKSVFARNLANFKRMFRKKGFLHYYTNHGVAAEDFEEAINELTDLGTEYKDREAQPTSIYDEDTHFELDITNRNKLQKNAAFKGWANDKRKP